MQRSAGRIVAGYSAIVRPRNAARPHRTDSLPPPPEAPQNPACTAKPQRGNRVRTSGTVPLSDSSRPEGASHRPAAQPAVPATAPHRPSDPVRSRSTPLQPMPGCGQPLLRRPDHMSAAPPYVSARLTGYGSCSGKAGVRQRRQPSGETTCPCAFGIHAAAAPNEERNTDRRGSEETDRPSVPAPDGAKVSDRTCGRGTPATGGPGNACIPSKAPPRIKKARTRIRIRALHKITHKTPRGVVSIYFTSSNSTSSGCEPLPPSDAPPALACDCCPAFWAPAAPWACCWA